MLTSLLPGLRQLRAPVSAGVLLFIAIWVLFGESVLLPDRTADSPVERRLADLVDLVGRSGVVVFLVSAAYLVGTFIVVPARPIRPIAPPRNDKETPNWANELYAWAARASWRLSVTRDGVDYSSIREDESGTIPHSFVRDIFKQWRAAHPDRDDSETNSQWVTDCNDDEEEEDDEDNEEISLWTHPIPEDILRESLARHACTDGLTMLPSICATQSPIFGTPSISAEPRRSFDTRSWVPWFSCRPVFAWAGSPIYLLATLFSLALFLWAQRLEKESLKTIGIALNAGFIDDYLVEYLEKNHTADRPTDVRIVMRGAAALPVIRSIRDVLDTIRWSLVEHFRRKVGDRYY